MVNRDRIAVLTALLGITALAWVYLSLMAVGMEADSITGAGVLTIRPWSLLDFLLMFWMWAVMMVGMMVPTAIPMTLIYTAVSRKASEQNSPLAPTALFVSGYIVMWTLFSLIATAAQWILEQGALLSPTMVMTSPSLGATLLIVTGIYQWTPYKNACLDHCRSPAQFFAGHWRPGKGGAFRMGLEQGGFCLGCCWLLMALLFVGGVMNLLWVAAITLFILLEKLVPLGLQTGRFAGLALILVGLLVLVRLHL